MCHESPTASILTTLITSIGLTFIGWHIKAFDNGRCLLYTRRNAFRWTILWMLLISLVGFFTWNVVLVYVKYKEYYAVIPITATTVDIIPVPFQLWSTSRQDLVRVIYHLLSISWAFLLTVHAEETLYWAYLIGSIRSRDNRSWFKSLHFKIWCICAIATMMGMPAVSFIETSSLTTMENNIFLAGSSFAMIMAIGSLWLIVIFPGFIEESRRQGANPEVIGRLHYFKELNLARAAFRGIYASTLLALAIDGTKGRKFLNTTPFWLDTLFIAAYFSAIASTCISLMILLPRSMTSEAGITRTAAPVFLRHTAGPFTMNPNRHPPSSQNSSRPGFRDLDRQSSNPWGALGDRLNLDKADLDDLDVGEMYELPFAAQPGSRVLRQGKEFQPVIPGHLRDFTGPLAVNQPQGPVDLTVIVTSTTVIEKHE